MVWCYPSGTVPTLAAGAVQQFGCWSATFGAPPGHEGRTHPLCGPRATRSGGESPAGRTLAWYGNIVYDRGLDIQISKGCQHGRQACGRGVNIESCLGRPDRQCQTLHRWFSMAQRPPLDTPPSPEVSSTDTDGDQTTRPSPELRIERSRFSRLLARFGLGELTDPILRPTKPSAGRTPNG